MFRKNLIIYLLVYGLVMLSIYYLPTSDFYNRLHNELTFAKQEIRSKSIDPIDLSQNDQVIRNESNLNNGGVALETQDAYYLVNDMLLLEKMDKSYSIDPSFTARSDRWSIGGLQIVGDWLFYTSNGIHRINLDGSREELLYKGHVMDCYVTPEWIYFVDYKNGSRLFRMTPNGENLTCLNESRFRDLLYTGRNFYAAITTGREADDGTIVRLDLKGNENLVIEEAYGHNLLIDGEYLYYRKSADWYLWRTNLTSLESEVVIDHRMTDFALDEDFIYYSTRDENSPSQDELGLYRMDRVSGETIILDGVTKRSTGMIQLLGNSVLIESDYKDRPFGKIRMDQDGSNPILMPGRDS